MNTTLTYNQKQSRFGFTLIELLVVILILGILAALIVPRVLNNVGTSKVAAAKTDLSTLASALDTFHLDCDRYPTQDEGMQALRTAPSGLTGKWKGPYLQKDVPADPWGNQYIYKSPGESGGSDTYTIESYGSDGQPGGTGDAADIIQNGG